MKFNLYEIRLCRKDEYEKLIGFIHDYWKEDHIFCKSKELFEFQHGDAANGYYDFVIAVHRESDEIHAVLGFIRMSLYDGCNDVSPQAVYGALWKVRDDVHNRENGKLGLGVLYYLIKNFPDSSYITLGLSHFSQDIYQALHFEFGKMKQYYIANSNLNDFSIAKTPRIGKALHREDVIIRKMTDAESILNDFYPNKNVEYIRKRYLKHPMYSYDLLGIYVNGKLVSEWVIRPIQIGESICLRLVDIVGSVKGLNNIRGNIIDILEKYKAEYIDCFNYGIESAVFEQMGFFEVNEDVIIPNYFEPFEQRNVDIYYAFYGKKPVVIFKADGDQDRPSILVKGDSCEGVLFRE